MTESTRPHLPLLPLLHAYPAPGLPDQGNLRRLSGFGSRFQTILDAKGELLAESFLDNAGEAEFETVLVRFYEACVQPALHVETLRRRAGMVRFALGHLLRCRDPLVRRAEHCLAPDGPYHVPGLGPAFWSALFQALDPVRHAGWTPAVVAGLRRLGLARWRPHATSSRVYDAILDAYARIRSLRPGLTALDVDHFLTLVATMQGRELPCEAAPAVDLASVLTEVRTRVPLRQRLKERGQALHEARRQLEAGLGRQDGALIGAALTVSDPASASRAAIDWDVHAEGLALWAGRLWEADDPYERLEEFWRADPIPGAGLWLPAAVLHLRDPRRFQPWPDAARQGYTHLDDSGHCGLSPAQSYLLFNEGIGRLRLRHRVHALEATDLLAALATDDGPGTTDQGQFQGFCTDTFRFLAELARNNRRDWMDGQRERYQFVVRQPLIELCRALADRYVEPVLCREHGWDLETAPRSGRALTSICKNDYGQTVPYHTVLWITFYRRGRKGNGTGRVGEVQFFVRLDENGLSYGLRLGRSAREAGRLFRDNVREHAALLHQTLCDSGALAECRFGDADDVGAVHGPATPADLQAWAAAELFPDAPRRRGAVSQLVIAKAVPAGAPLLRSEELVGDILLTFNRLLPAYLCAVEADPLPKLTRRGVATFTEADFWRATFLSAEWVRCAQSLLELKRQLILQGVPGTGKTHVARCLARLLTGGRDEMVRLVQFHPAYSYEEFVEGIKVRSVEIDGRHDVTYPVEEGLLCSFAREAAGRPGEPHVLLIDEINRGNLARIFGELLYLLEYRDQSIRLPYSKREVRLPANLYLVGTMNAADRSVALVDQALRRRFSFLEMAPDVGVLAAWLRQHPPRAGTALAERVLSLFERLNARLRSDFGPACQVGHSYFMVPELDEARLRVVWEHQVEPLLEEYAAGDLSRLAGYSREELLAGGRPRRAPRLRRPAGVSG